jgi:hypothetical protein
MPVCRRCLRRRASNRSFYLGRGGTLGLTNRSRVFMHPLITGSPSPPVSSVSVRLVSSDRVSLVVSLADGFVSLIPVVGFVRRSQSILWSLGLFWRIRFRLGLRSRSMHINLGSFQRIRMQAATSHVNPCTSIWVRSSAFQSWVSRSEASGTCRREVWAYGPVLRA